MVLDLFLDHVSGHFVTNCSGKVAVFPELTTPQLTSHFGIFSEDSSCAETLEAGYNISDSGFRSRYNQLRRASVRLPEIGAVKAGIARASIRRDAAFTIGFNDSSANSNIISAKNQSARKARQKHEGLWRQKRRRRVAQDEDVEAIADQ